MVEIYIDFCAKRSLRPSASQNQMFRPFVQRPPRIGNIPVRSSVRKIITFCEEDMRGNHVPVGNGVLNDRFFRFWKVLKKIEKKCSKCTFLVRITRSSKSGFEPVLINFWWTFLKLWKRGFWRGLRGWKKLRNWRILGALLGVDFMIWLGVNQCFAPLPCTVYLVYFFEK